MKRTIRKRAADYIARRYHARIFATVAWLYFMHGAIQYLWREHKRTRNRGH